MAISTADKVKIRSLRATGLTYPEIRRALGIDVPKSSLSYICKDVALPDAYRQKLKALNERHLQAVRVRAVARNKELQANRLEALSAKNEPLCKNVGQDVLKISLAMLYLGEGSKWRSYRGLSLGSSDPDIICLYIKLLHKCYAIDVNKLRVRIQHRADQNVGLLEKYWSSVTGIPTEQFYKSYADKRSVGKVTKRSDYRGVCVIMCSGTEIQLELATIAKLLLKHLDQV